MLDHMILTVSNVERSLAFYEAALRPPSKSFVVLLELLILRPPATRQINPHRNRLDCICRR